MSRASEKITIHTTEDFVKMRAAGKAAAEVLDYIASYVDVGVTTLKLNDLCHEEILRKGAIPAPLNYRGFPKSICTSINSVVCHGIPKENDVLQDGDIVNVDVTLIVDGWHGDCSRTFMVGRMFKKNHPKVAKLARLVKVTYEAMMLGIDQVAPGKCLTDIGRAIQTYAEKNGFSVVRDYCGHGIGKVFHAMPNVIHYVPKPDEADFDDVVLKSGMFFTIEPMINIGHYGTVLSKADGWTVFTKDGSPSAQFEHSIGVTDRGFEIFTASPKNIDFPAI